MPLSCSVLGHAYVFRADGSTLRWDCRRCATPGGTKTYADSQAAARYAGAFESRPGDGHRMTPLGLTPLALGRWLRRRCTERTAGVIDG